MYDFDHDLFLALNFDGGPTVDRIMFTISGTTMWIPLYLLILWMVWRRGGWRDTLLFFVLMVGAIVLSDMLCGMFKANGVMGELLPDFQPRWRPMFTPELEGLAITPDSLYVIRQTGMAGDWAVHVPVKAVAGHYGTVSAHAATIVTMVHGSDGRIDRRDLLFTHLSRETFSDGLGLGCARRRHTGLCGMEDFPALRKYRKRRTEKRPALHQTRQQPLIK